MSWGSNYSINLPTTASLAVRPQLQKLYEITEPKHSPHDYTCTCTILFALMIIMVYDMRSVLPYHSSKQNGKINGHRERNPMSFPD